MQNKPLVSITCITYNHEKYIGQAIEGFLKQETNFPVEIIIHDDASSDRTPQIIREYTHAHPGLIIPILQTENQYSQGKKPFIHFVFPQTRGKYIAMCEGDDYWTDPYKLQKQVDFLEANPDYVSCYHDAMIIDEDGKIINVSKLPDNYKKDFSSEEISKGAWILTLTHCFRNLLKDIPDEIVHVYNGDTFFNSLLGRFGKGKYMADIIPAVYRKHSTSIWSRLEESEKMYHGGVTRTWMYRYYKRTEQFEVANYFKNLAIDHFDRGLKIAATKNRHRYEFITNMILAEYSDIMEGESAHKLNISLNNKKYHPVNNNSKINKILFVNHNIYPLEISGTPLSTRNHAHGMAQRGLEVAVLIPRGGIKNGYKKELSADGYLLYQVPPIEKLTAYFIGSDQEGMTEYWQVIEDIIDDFSPQVVHINDYVRIPAEIIEIFSRNGCLVVREVCNCEEFCHRDYPVISSGLDGKLCSGPENPLKCAVCFSVPPMDNIYKQISKESSKSLGEKTKRRFDHVKKLYSNAVDKIIFTSEPFKAYFTRFVPISEEKIAVIPRGFKFDYLRREKKRKSFKEQIQFAFVGHLMFSKGIDVALRAFEKICNENDFVLHIYGSLINSEYDDWIKELQKSHPDKFIYHGLFKTEDISKIASNIDMCIIPSYFDTYNRVVREILCLGVPVIATDFFGAYIIENGMNGFKIPLGDAEALAEKMTAIIHNPLMLEDLSRGVERTHIPSLEEEIDQLIEVYEDIYNKAPEKKKAALDKMITFSEKRRKHPDIATKLIAFYLPQYHPIPENDRWWGKGFTEWTNVVKAAPLFPGHYQPHLPGELGFYDLRLPETRKAQAELAREHGIYGFCYYHYWFNGKLLLDYPLEQVLKSGEPDFPFCLCWANENWTRAWDGRQGEVLIQQHYSEEDDQNHIRWLLSIFKDERYIRINGKPLMLIYLANSIPDATRTMKMWREEAKKGGDDLYLCKVESAPWEYGDPQSQGFDACIEFQPDWGNLGLVKNQLPGGHVVYDYADVTQRMVDKPVPPYKRYPCVTPMWDNSARRKQAALVLDGSTPELYEKWLKTVVGKIDTFQLDDKIVFINAWNEWAEGNHLEPDEKNGRAYLEATKRALSKISTTARTIIKDLTSVVILTFNELEYTKKCIRSLQKHTPELHEIIFVDNGSTDGTVKWLKKLLQENKNYKLLENKQNLGFAKGCNQGVEVSQGEYILLLNNDVVVSKDWLSGLIDCLNHAPKAGIIGPMTNNISGPQRISDKSYTSADQLDRYAATFREKYRHRRIPFRRIVGFCMLFRQELINHIGRLDESFGTGNFEDDDFCLRAILAGHENYIAGDVFIHHFGSRSFVGNKINYAHSIQGNRKIIDKKWTLSTQSEEGKRLTVILMMEKADNLYQKGKFDEAVEALVDCIKLTPEAKEIYYALVKMFIEEKRFTEAQDVINSMPEETKDELKSLEYMGYIKEGLGLDDEASVCIRQILIKEEEYPPAFNLKGVLAYKKGDKDTAREAFQKAATFDPGYGEPHTNLGVLHWGMDHKDKAFSYMQKGFILSPTIPDVSSLYYSITSSLGRFTEADESFREAARLNTNNKNIAFLYIETLIQQEKYSSALIEIENALDTFGLDEGTIKAAVAIRDKIGPLEIKGRVKKNTLSLCMIVKNEEKHLVKCLKSVRDIVDEMIVVDTGSTDRTRDIAKVFGAKTFDLPWTNDFSAARNHSLQQATGDWILVLDADEVISDFDHEDLLKIIDRRDGQSVAFNMVTRTYLEKSGSAGWTENDGTYPREEKGIGWYESNKVRLFRNSNMIRFENPVHELLEASLNRAGIAIEKCSIPVHHYGRFDHDKLLAKGRDYYLLGRKKLEESGGGDYTALRELAVQAGELCMFDEAICLWQKTLALRPDDVDSLFNLGYHYMQIGKYQEALRASKKAFELSPETKDALLNYALCEMLTGNLSKTKNLLEKYELCENENPAIMSLLGASYFMSGNNERGAAVFGKITKVNPAPYVNSLLEKLFAGGQIEYANRLIDTALSFKIADSETLRLRATFLN